MKNIGLPRLASLLMLTFGITFLNFEDLSVEANWKAYTLILLGVTVLSYSLFTKKTSGNKS